MLIIAESISPVFISILQCYWMSLLPVLLRFPVFLFITKTRQIPDIALLITNIGNPLDSFHYLGSFWSQLPTSLVTTAALTEQYCSTTSGAKKIYLHLTLMTVTSVNYSPDHFLSNSCNFFFLILFCITICITGNGEFNETWTTSYNSCSFNYPLLEKARTLQNRHLILRKKIHLTCLPLYLYLLVRKVHLSSQPGTNT